MIRFHTLVLACNISGRKVCHNVITSFLCGTVAETQHGKPIHYILCTRVKGST